MKKRGIIVPEAGLGFKIFNLPYLKIRVSPEFTFCIHPFLLGAYVRPANGEDINRLPYSAKTHIYGAGVIANLIMGAILLGLYVILAMIEKDTITSRAVIILAVSVGSSLLLWIGSRIFCSYIFPFLGFLILGQLAWSVMKTGLGESVMGPIGIIQSGLNISTFPEAVFWGANISIGLALINLLPIVPLDGGHIFLAVMEKIFGNKGAIRAIVTTVGIIAFSLLIMAVMYSDILRLLS